MYKFAQKLFTLGKTVIISVPYKWPKGRCKEHVHDPVDENKLYNWVKKKPDQYWVIKEDKYAPSDKRLICLYLS